VRAALLAAQSSADFATIGVVSRVARPAAMTGSASPDVRAEALWQITLQALSRRSEPARLIALAAPTTLRHCRTRAR
jgi:hypothetical protein